MNDEKLFTLIAQERRSTADILDQLTPEQWATQSLCSAWTVRETAAHLTMGWNVSMPKFMIGMIKHRGFNKFNAAVNKESGKRETAVIIADLRDNAEHRFTPPGAGAIAPFTDAIVHTADIRYPLGIPSATPHSSAKLVLASLAQAGKKSPLPLKDASGLRFEATDQDWTAGSGAVVSGTTDALLLGLSGRNVLDDLSGEGVALLRQRQQ